MLTRMIMLVSLLFSLSTQQTMAATGTLFSVSASELNLTIRSLVPNHTYPYAGIKILNSSQYQIANTTTSCQQVTNEGSCLFSASDTVPHTILLTGHSGVVELRLCLNGKNMGTSCQTYSLPLSLSHTIGGSISGLATTGLVLQNNGGDNLSVDASATEFQFATPVAEGQNYNVTVQQQPTGASCSVENGSGSVIWDDVTDVSLTCSPHYYTVGGPVTGLRASGLVLQNNGGDNLSVGDDASSYQFITSLMYGSSYNVTIHTQPNRQLCSVSNGSGSDMTANITNANVNCTTTPYAYVSADSQKSV